VESRTPTDLKSKRGVIADQAAFARQPRGGVVAAPDKLPPTLLTCRAKGPVPRR